MYQFGSGYMITLDCMPSPQIVSLVLFSVILFLLDIKARRCLHIGQRLSGLVYHISLSNVLLPLWVFSCFYA